MRVRRLFFFLLSLVVGIGAGLVVAWGARPAPLGETMLPALRSDYRTDYILMAAEAFSQDGDLIAVSARLAALGEESPARAVQLAILAARDLGYSNRDVELLAKLSQALQKYTPMPAAGATP